MLLERKEQFKVQRSTRWKRGDQRNTPKTAATPMANQKLVDTDPDEAVLERGGGK
jgi:hypothetical protein